MFRVMSLVAVVCSSALSSAEYKFVQIGHKDGHIYFTAGNDYGNATGFIEFFETTEHWKSGEVRAIFYDGKTQKVQILGTLYTPRKVVHLGSQEDNESKGLAINNRNVITGWTHVGAGDHKEQHAFLWTPEKGMQDLKTLGGDKSAGNDIGPGNEVVGYSNLKQGSKTIHACMWHSGQATDLGVVEEKGMSEAKCIAYVQGELMIGGTATYNVHWNVPHNVGFLYSQGKLKPLFKKGTSVSLLRSVNALSSNGICVGDCEVMYPDGHVASLEDCQGNGLDINAQGIVITNQNIYPPGSTYKKVEDLYYYKGKPFFTEISSVSDSGYLYGFVRYRSDEYRNEYLGSVAVPSKPFEVANVVLDPHVEEEVEEEEYSRRKIVFMAHGFASSSEAWARDLQRVMKAQAEKRPDASQWHIVAFDWSEDADGAHRLYADLGTPKIAAGFAKELGKQWGEIYNKQNPEVVHLIGHSAGSHFIEAMCKELNDSDTWVHITFLDAYEIGNVYVALGSNADFAEHYRFANKSRALDPVGQWFSHGGQAGNVLPTCFNVDVSGDMSIVDQILSKPWMGEHSFPCKWYTNSASRGEKYGLALSPVFRDKLVTFSEFPKGDN